MNNSIFKTFVFLTLTIGLPLGLFSYQDWKGRQKGQQAEAAYQAKLADWYQTPIGKAYQQAKAENDKQVAACEKAKQDELDKLLGVSLSTYDASDRVTDAVAGHFWVVCMTQYPLHADRTGMPVKPEREPKAKQ